MVHMVVHGESRRRAGDVRSYTADRERAVHGAQIRKKEAQRANQERLEQARAASEERRLAAAIIWLEEPVTMGNLRIVGVSSEKQRQEVMEWVK
jgi:hypothetical protein